MFEELGTVMDKISLLVLLSLVLVVKSNIPIDTGGYDRIGGNMHDMPFVLGAGSTSGDCAALCSYRDGCQSWAFGKCGSQIVSQASP